VRVRAQAQQAAPRVVPRAARPAARAEAPVAAADR
jgi:hypothetical protein